MSGGGSGRQTHGSVTATRWRKQNSKETAAVRSPTTCTDDPSVQVSHESTLSCDGSVVSRRPLRDGDREAYPTPYSLARRPPCEPEPPGGGPRSLSQGQRGMRCVGPADSRCGVGVTRERS